MALQPTRPRRPRARKTLIGGKPTAHTRASGHLVRGSIISPGSPATIQLEGSSPLVARSLAQHVAQQTTPIAAGDNIVAVTFDTANPGDGAIIAAY